MLDFWYPEKLDQGGGLLQEGRQSGGVGPIQPLARSASGARGWRCGTDPLHGLRRAV